MSKITSAKKSREIPKKHEKLPAEERRPRRLSPEDRKLQILNKAIQFFAAVGFGGGTRELAQNLGMTQPLLYRYFPTKEALIEEVYTNVFLNAWQENWGQLLGDRKVPLRQRLIQFYEEYSDVIMHSEWMRIYLFAALKDSEINRRYIALLEERILDRIVREFRQEAALAEADISAEDREIAWILQSAVFYYGVRCHVYNLPMDTPRAVMIEQAVDSFLLNCAARFKKPSHNSDVGAAGGVFTGSGTR